MIVSAGQTGVDLGFLRSSSILAFILLIEPHVHYPAGKLFVAEPFFVQLPLNHQYDNVFYIKSVSVLIMWTLQVTSFIMFPSLHQPRACSPRTPSE